MRERCSRQELKSSSPEAADLAAPREAPPATVTATASEAQAERLKPLERRERAGVQAGGQELREVGMGGGKAHR
jgi:hypothetical protein